MYGWFIKQFVKFMKFKSSEVHEVATKLTKIEKGGRRSKINMSALNQKISGQLIQIFLL